MGELVEKDVNYLHTKMERGMLRLNERMESEMVRLRSRMDKQVSCINQRLDKQVASLKQDVVALQHRADYLLNVITRISSRNNNQSWTLAIGLLDDVEVEQELQCDDHRCQRE